MGGLPEKPLNRKELYLSKIAGEETQLPPAPLNREEMYLEYIAEHGTGGTYSKEEIDNKISAIIQEIDWKESVDTVEDLETTYPDAVAGWTASVKENEHIYRFDGENWVDIYTLAPLATAEIDGLMSAQKVKDLTAIKSLTIDNANKNLLRTPYADVSGTRNGLNITVNDDGSLTLNGTTTAQTYFNFASYLISTSYFSPYGIDRGEYILEIGTDTNVDLTGITLTKYIRANNQNYDRKEIALEETNKIDFNVTVSGIFHCFLVFEAGTTLNNVTLYPMLRRAGVEDNTYETYYRSQKTLDADLTTVENQVDEIEDKVEEHSALLIDNASKNLAPIYDKIVKDTAQDNYFISNISGGQQVTLSFACERVEGATISNNDLYPCRRIYEFDKDGNQLLDILITSAITLSTGSTYRFTKTWTLQNGTTSIKIDFSNYNNDANYNTRKYDVQLEYNAAVTDFISHYRSQRQLDADLTTVGAELGVLKSEIDYNLLFKSDFRPNIWNSNGITFTYNPEDGTVTVNGTPITGDSYYVLQKHSRDGFYLPIGNYSLTDGVTQEGAGVYIITYHNDESTNQVLNTLSDKTQKFTIGQEDDSVIGYEVGVQVRANTTVSNLVIKPMITKAEYEGLPFKPYVRSIKQIDDALKVVENDIDVLKSEIDYNLLPLTLTNMKSLNSEGTWTDNEYTIDGMIYTINTTEKGYVSSIVVNGTSASSTSSNARRLYLYRGNFYNWNSYYFTDGGDYSANIYVNLQQQGGNYKTYLQREGVINVPDGATQRIFISVPNVGITFDNYIFYPMITKPEYEGLPFKPYTPPTIDSTPNYNLFNIGGLIERSNYPYENNGVTFTINQNNTITATGTSGQYGAYTTIQIPNNTLSGKYLITGISNGSSSTYSMRVFSYDSSASAAIEWYTGEQEYTFTAGVTHYIQLKIGASYAIPSGGITFSPMIIPTTFAGSPYQPYIPSGKELLDTIIHTTIGVEGATKIYPYNQTTTSITFQEQRLNTDYTVDVHIDNVTGSGDVGTVFVTGKTRSGFSVGFTGSASTADVTIVVRGGWT